MLSCNISMMMTMMHGDDNVCIHPMEDLAICRKWLCN